MITEEQYTLLLSRIESLENKVSDLESRIEIVNMERSRSIHKWPYYMGEFVNRDYSRISIPGSQRSITDNQYDGYEVTSITIGDGIEEIGWQGIARCKNISELIIPASVRKIGYLFCYCCSGLHTVRFLGPCPEGLERAFEECPNLGEIMVPGEYAEDYMTVLEKLMTIIKSE